MHSLCRELPFWNLQAIWEPQKVPCYIQEIGAWAAEPSPYAVLDILLKTGI